MTRLTMNSLEELEELIEEMLDCMLSTGQLASLCNLI